MRINLSNELSGLWKCGHSVAKSSTTVLRFITTILSIIITIACTKDKGPAFVAEPNLLAIEHAESLGYQKFKVKVKRMHASVNEVTEMGICWTGSDWLPQMGDNILPFSDQEDRMVTIDRSGPGDTLTLRAFSASEGGVNYSAPVRIAMPQPLSILSVKKAPMDAYGLMDIQQVGASSLIMAGTSGLGGIHMQTHVVKMDTSLKVSWQTVLPAAETIEKVAIQPIEIGVYVVEHLSTSTGTASIKLSLLNNSGHLQWSKTLTNATFCRILGIGEGFKGNVMVAIAGVDVEKWSRHFGFGGYTYNIRGDQQEGFNIDLDTAAMWNQNASVFSGDTLIIGLEDKQRSLLVRRGDPPLFGWQTAVPTTKSWLRPLVLRKTPNNDLILLSSIAPLLGPQGFAVSILTEGGNIKVASAEHFLSPYLRSYSFMTPVNVFPNNDGTYYVLGSINRESNTRPYLVKMDKMGQKVWDFFVAGTNATGAYILPALKNEIRMLCHSPHQLSLITMRQLR